MPALNVTRPTLLDLAKITDPDGRIAKVVEILAQENEIFDDIVFREGNLPTGHLTTIRTGLPSVTWRRLYGGVQPSKSTTVQVEDKTGMIETYAEIDYALAGLNGNDAEWRFSEEKSFIEAFSQEATRALIYESERSNPERITGLAPRYSTRLAASAASAENVIHAGGSGTDNTSIWLIGWGEETIHGIVPKGSTAGLQITDKGRVTVENIDGNNGRAEMYRTHYRLDLGLTVKDWRYAVRICNIDKSDLSPTVATGANLPNLMFQAMERIPSFAKCNAKFYMSRNARMILRQQVASAVTNATLEDKNVGGKMLSEFQGIPIGRVDALSADEALVPNT